MCREPPRWNIRLTSKGTGQRGIVNLFHVKSVHPLDGGCALRLFSGRVEEVSESAEHVQSIISQLKNNTVWR